MVPWKTPLSWRARTLALVLGVIAAYVGPSVTAAHAARGHVFSTSFGEKGKGAGQFEEPAGIAVNESKGESESGDVYVVDKGDDRVEVFNSKDEYQFEFNGSGKLLNECNKLGECIAAGGGE